MYWLLMQKLTITIALAVIALALGTTTITTTMRIQPAYSQATHCAVPDRASLGTRCVTPGQDPSITVCVRDYCGPSRDIAHQETGQLIGRFIHHPCANSETLTCTVTPPERPK